MAAGDQPGPAQEGGKGIPLWVIIGGVVVVAGYLYLRNKNAAAGAANTSALQPGITTDPNTGLPVDPLTGLPYITNPQQAPTNESWAAGAEAWAAAHGIGAGLANQALYDYLNGNSLTAQEADILNKILTSFGQPPNILPFFAPPGWTGQPPKPPAPPKPPPTKKPTLPQLNAGKFPQFISGILHSPLYKIPRGAAVVNGAPVYALVNTGYGPIYEQGQAVKAAQAKGQQLFTLPQFSKYVQK